MLNAYAPIRVIVIVGSLLIGSGVGWAQSTDWHLSSGGAPAFFSRSAFAHGYMHGYEEGFHRGDLDVQMGRGFQPLKQQDKFKKICGYRPEFGGRKTFQRGYRKGYAVGYTDSYAGRNFRAIQLVEEAKADDLGTTNPAPDPHFDEVFIEGYDSGQKAGLADGRSNGAISAMDAIHCGQWLPAPDHDYCQAYERGYLLGYSDGYANQRDSGPVFARK